MMELATPDAGQAASSIPADGRKSVRRMAIPCIDADTIFDVTVEDGLFASIRPTGDRADSAGPGGQAEVPTLWPAYTECHAHVALPPNFDDSLDDPAIVAMQYLYHGVAHVVDMFGFPLVKAAWERSAALATLPYPEVAHCGYAVTAMCGYDGKIGHGSEFPAPVFMLGGKHDLDVILDGNRHLGATFLKVMFTDGVEQPGGSPRFSRISPELLAALAQVASARGISCVLDCNTRDEVMLAHRFGFRYFAHAVRDVVLSDADWQQLSGSCFVSTLSGLRPMVLQREEFLDEYGRPGFPDTQDTSNLAFVAGIDEPFGIKRNCQESRTRAVETMRQNSLAALERGMLLAGTDAGNGGCFHGYSLLGELRLLGARPDAANLPLQTVATVTGRQFFDRMAGHASPAHPLRVGAAATFNLFSRHGHAAGGLPDATVIRGIPVDRQLVVKTIQALRASPTQGKITL